ncbi:MAG TPA: hypothetical protein VFW39_00085 [Sphingomicrobium sp.]|nr:hypothetical protein [Sphingomicrobium sp.]
MTATTLSVTDFKAHCLELFDRLTKGTLDCIEVTRRGKVVAIVKPPPAMEEKANSVHGCMKGMALIAPGVDLTEPLAKESLDAAEGLSDE